MSSTATMFLNDITCIDHAFIDSNGRVHGGSYNLSMEITGPVTDSESVVVDFSNIKSTIKKLIDDRDNGFDHKLWIIPNSLAKVKVEDEYVIISGNGIVVTLPSNAVRIFSRCADNNHVNSTDKDLITQEITKYLLMGLADIYNTEFKIKCILVDYPSFSDSVQTFRYVHGLKNSSSWGCQNILHGHTSYIRIVSYPMKAVDIVEDSIINFLNDSMFIFKDNIRNVSGKMYNLSYSTGRGDFNLSITEDGNNLIIMDKETTIENIVEYVANRFKSELMSLGKGSLYISEGLSKGAVIKFDSRGSNNELC